MTTREFAQSRVLVTGGGGFIGSHLVDALRQQGALVRVLDNFSTGNVRNLSHCLAEIELIEGDIRDAATCRRACEGAQFVFHEAALGSVPRSFEDPATTIAVNVTGTGNVFAAARDAKVARVVYASSSSVYGDSTSLPKREGEEGRPLSPYAASKKMNEDLADVFARSFSMELAGLRYFNVYGPRQDPRGPYAAVIPRFFGSNLKGEAAVIYGTGDQSRDFTYVADAVRANLLAAVAGPDACGAAYNVGSGTRTTVNELARTVREIVGGAPEPRHEAARPGDVAHSLADLSRIGGAIRYTPTVTLFEGLRHAFGHYSDAHAVLAGPESDSKERRPQP